MPMMPPYRRRSDDTAENSRQRITPPRRHAVRHALPAAHTRALRMQQRPRHFAIFPPTPTRHVAAPRAHAYLPEEGKRDTYVFDRGLHDIFFSFLLCTDTCRKPEPKAQQASEN